MAIAQEDVDDEQHVDTTADVVFASEMCNNVRVEILDSNNTHHLIISQDGEKVHISSHNSELLAKQIAVSIIDYTPHVEHTEDKLILRFEEIDNQIRIYESGDSIVYDGDYSNAKWIQIGVHAFNVDEYNIYEFANLFADDLEGYTIFRRADYMYEKTLNLLLDEDCETRENESD